LQGKSSFCGYLSNNGKFIKKKYYNTIYKDYINSSEWYSLKFCFKKILLEKQDKITCAICDDKCHSKIKHCHHWKYPKIFQNDSIDNLIYICDICHKIQHLKYPLSKWKWYNTSWNNTKEYMFEQQASFNNDVSMYIHKTKLTNINYHNIIMNFGKYKGQLISSIPSTQFKYCVWAKKYMESKLCTSEACNNNKVYCALCGWLKEYHPTYDLKFKKKKYNYV